MLEASCMLQDFVDMQLKECHGALENVSKQILVRTIPFVLNAVTGELFWMQNRIVDWDLEVDLSKLFRQSPEIPQCTLDWIAFGILYCLKKVVFVF